MSGLAALKGELLMPITFASPGSQEQIKRISGKDEIRRHLADLGFSVGAYVTVVSAINGNVILNVRDSRVALDKSMANRIMV